MWALEKLRQRLMLKTADFLLELFFSLSTHWTHLRVNLFRQERVKIEATFSCWWLTSSGASNWFASHVLDVLKDNERAPRIKTFVFDRWSGCWKQITWSTVYSNHLHKIISARTSKVSAFVFGEKNTNRTNTFLRMRERIIRCEFGSILLPSLCFRFKTLFFCSFFHSLCCHKR